MTDYVSSPSAIQFIITYGTAHPGQNFESVDDARFKLTFGKVKSHAGYTEGITAVSYGITMNDVVFLHNYAEGPLLPASFTIITSRTNPDEPQPIV